MSSRIYVARDTEGKVKRLVWAGHPSQALKHCFEARVASQTDLIELIEAGVPIERLAVPQPEPQPEMQPTA